MVFQSYALYPHMTVFENMSFGLRLARLDAREIDAAVRSAARKLHIEHLLDRKPKALSGGQKQRVAIGRAIVRKPNVFLLTSPSPISTRRYGRACATSSLSSTRSSRRR